MKSVIDISPIVFLNVGQEQAGIFDFEIQASQNYDNLIKGDKNPYNNDPFFYASSNLSVNSTQTAKLSPFQVIDYGDSIYIAGLKLLKFENYKNMLDPLS